MPDVWTFNPEKLRTILQSHERDISCGVTPRIIMNRDPEWTCAMEWNEGDVHWIGEVYIHSAPDPVLCSAIFFVVGAALGLLAGKRVGQRQAVLGRSS